MESEQVYGITFDVGGTTIKGAAVTGEGRVEEGTFTQVDSRSGASAGEILDNLYITIKNTAERTRTLCPQARIAGVGFAFPGPFDYVRGISFMRGLNKFDALYGVNVKEELMRRIATDALLGGMFVPPVRIVFGNDASMFALGEAHFGAARRYRRSVCLTIGTGLGSGFVEEGRLVERRDDVPEDGWLYRLPWKNGIVDDAISRRGILRMAEEMGLAPGITDVKELALEAQAGNAAARALFERFGAELAEVLSAYAVPFRPEGIVLGGQISRSFELFAASLRERLAALHVKAEVVRSADSLHSTFRGILHELLPA